MRTRITLLGLLACVLALGTIGCAGADMSIASFDEALELQKAGEYEAAIEQYKEFLAMEGKSDKLKELDAAAQFEIAACLVKLENKDEAIKAFTAVIKNYAGSAHAEDAQKEIDILNEKPVVEEEK
jgi:tetratricopeptide (TPR) repeat protein